MTYPSAWQMHALRGANTMGIALAAIGGVVALIGTLVDWYSPSVSLRDIILALDAPGAKAFPQAYFQWLMWVLLALTVAAALFANTVSPLSTALRVASPILGALGVVLVLVSLGQVIEGASIFSHASGGLWLVLGGFVVAGAAGTLGPVRLRPPHPPR